MKKIIIALAAIASAVVANAGAINWKIYDVDAPDSGYAYLFTSNTDMAEVTASVLAGTFFTDYTDSDWIYAGEISEGEYLSGAILNGEYEGSTTLWMLALDSDSAGYGNYLISNDDGVTQKIGASGTKSFEFTYGDNLTEWTAVADVPEPTSGLLMLLGMAGLALRRRRS